VVSPIGLYVLRFSILLCTSLMLWFYHLFWKPFSWVKAFHCLVCMCVSIWMYTCKYWDLFCNWSQPQEIDLFCQKIIEYWGLPVYEETRERGMPTLKLEGLKEQNWRGIYLWSKEVVLFCFICHAEIFQTMVLHVVLLISSKSFQWVGVPQLGFRLFGAMLWKLLIIEPLSQ
jgi:hypothetical protein